MLYSMGHEFVQDPLCRSPGIGSCINGTPDHEEISPRSDRFGWGHDTFLILSRCTSGSHTRSDDHEFLTARFTDRFRLMGRGDYTVKPSALSCLRKMEHLVAHRASAS